MIGNQRSEPTETLRLPAPRTSRLRSPGGWEAEVVYDFFLVVSHDPIPPWREVGDDLRLLDSVWCPSRFMRIRFSSEK
jgi:hypothetical protein